MLQPLDQWLCFSGSEFQRHSARRWILVLKPPRLRPKEWYLLHFHCPYSLECLLALLEPLINRLRQLPGHLIQGHLTLHDRRERLLERLNHLPSMDIGGEWKQRVVGKLLL